MGPREERITAPSTENFRNYRQSCLATSPELVYFPKSVLARRWKEGKLLKTEMDASFLKDQCQELPSFGDLGCGLHAWVGVINGAGHCESRERVNSLG